MSLDNKLLEICAMEYANIKNTQFLLNKGASVNARDKYGLTPLHIAVQEKNACIADVLIKNGADVNAQCNENKTPLHHAVEYGGSGLVELLLSYRPNTNITDEFDNTPLYYAIKNSKVKIFFVFLLYGTHMSEQDQGIIKNNLKLASCLAEFEQIKAMPHLDELIEAHKNRNKGAILDYINDSGKQKVLIQELKTVKERCKKLSFIPEYLSFFIKRKIQQYLSEYKRNLFGTGALYGLLEQVIGSSLILPTKNYEFDSNSAYNISLTCQNTYKHANFHMNTYLKKENRKVETLYTELKEVTSLRSICTIL